MGIALQIAEAILTLAVSAGVLHFAISTLRRDEGTMHTVFCVYSICWSVAASLTQLYAFHDAELLPADVGLTFGLSTFVIAFGALGRYVRPMWYVCCMLLPTLQVITAYTTQ